MNKGDKVYVISPAKSLVLSSNIGIQVQIGTLKAYTDTEAAVYVVDSKNNEVLIIVPITSVCFNLNDTLQLVGTKLENITNELNIQDER